MSALRLTLAASLGLLVGGTALADDAANKAPSPSSFQRMDSDGNGQVTQQEFIDTRAARFGKLDLDSDGKVTGEEFDKATDQHTSGANQGQTMVRVFDMNGDGGASIEEFKAVAAAAFAKADANKDGMLTEDEMPKPKADGS
jgi:Ca2+-binding EF-hand superfamily protein